MTERRDLVRAAALCAAVLWSAPLAAAAALGDASRLGPSGVGPIVFGTTPAQAAATGTSFTHGTPSRGSTCYYLVPGSPRGLRFMVESGNIRRAELVESTIPTSDGFRVGDAATKLAGFYGARAVTSPDKYDPHMKTVAIAPKENDGAANKLVYKVKNGRIVSIVAGLRPQVDYVEGCS